MPQSYRRFDAGPDPFGRTWNVEFRWQQNGIAIRHADTVDVKFQLSTGDTVVEKVVALPHAALVEVSKRENRPISDPWCLKLAALHVMRMIETWEDMDKVIVTVPASTITEYNRFLNEAMQPA
jgi:hypothetical protein